MSEKSKIIIRPEIPNEYEIVNQVIYKAFAEQHGMEIGKFMIMFAEIYGEWNERRGSYKWQSLTKCATYYGYEFKAHDSLEDVKATLYCYKKMEEDIERRKGKC